MKTLFTLALVLFSLAATAQKSDTLSVIIQPGSSAELFSSGHGLVFTVGDVYKYMVGDENPWGDKIFHYLKIVDIEGGWIKYTKSDSIDSLNKPARVEKTRDFYKLYLKRNEWARL